MSSGKRVFRADDRRATKRLTERVAARRRKQRAADERVARAALLATPDDLQAVSKRQRLAVARRLLREAAAET